MRNKFFYQFIIYLSLFATITSCTNYSKNIDNFFDFSGETEDKAEEVKPIIQKEAEKTEPEEVKEVVKAKYEVKAEKKKQTKEKQSKKKVEATKPTPKKKLPLKKAEINSTRIYEVGYLAFDVGNIVIKMEPFKATENYVEYVTEIYSKTDGFVDMAMNWESYHKSHTRVYDDKVTAESFKSKTRLRDKKREIIIDFKDGKIAKEQVIPPEKSWKRPKVEGKDKSNVFDPISSYFQARKRIQEAIAKDYFNSQGVYNFIVPIYDARRRTDILMRLYEKRAENGNIKVELRQKPVAGYNKKELDKFNEGERLVTIILDKKNLLPLSVEAEAPVGSAGGKYVRDCNKSFRNCIK